MKTNFQKTTLKIKRLNKVIYAILQFKMLKSTTSKRAKKSVQFLATEVEQLKNRIYA